MAVGWRVSRRRQRSAPARPRAQRHARARRVRRRREIVADVAAAPTAPLRRARRTASLRHRLLVGRGGAGGDHLDRLAVAVAGVEIHAADRRAGGILREDAVDRAGRLEELLPVGRLERAQAAHRVGDHAAGVLLRLALAPGRARRSAERSRLAAASCSSRRAAAARAAPTARRWSGCGTAWTSATALVSESTSTRHCPIATNSRATRYTSGRPRSAPSGDQAQLALEADRKLLLQPAHGALHDVVVVEQPLGRARPFDRRRAAARQSPIGVLDGALGLAAARATRRGAARSGAGRAAAPPERAAVQLPTLPPPAPPAGAG